jgi:hypothetical protein
MSNSVSDVLCVLSGYFLKQIFGWIIFSASFSIFRIFFLDREFGELLLLLLLKSLFSLAKRSHFFRELFGEQF